MDEIGTGQTRMRTIIPWVIVFVAVLAAIWFLVGKHGPSKIPRVGTDGSASAPPSSAAAPAPQPAR